MIDTKRFIQIGKHAAGTLNAIWIVLFLTGCFWLYGGAVWLGLFMVITNTFNLWVWIPHYRLYAAMLKAEFDLDKEKKDAVLP